MFSESFLPNLVLFVAGQAAAWFYLRTGRLWFGGIATAVLWVAADWAVMAKYVFADTGSHVVGALVVMQLTAVLTVVMLAFERWRRRWSQTARDRSSLFSAGTAAYLRGASEEARTTFRRLVRTDPWDAAAWLALGNVARRAKDLGAARRCYRRCLRVDVTNEYTDLARRLLELQVATKSAVKSTAERPANVKVPAQRPAEAEDRKSPPKSASAADASV